MLVALGRRASRRARALAAVRAFASSPRRARDAASAASSSNHGLHLAALAVGMVGATYAAVPLYRMFCQATGFGGTVRVGESVEEKLRARRAAPAPAAPARELTITFNADVADGLHWTFVPAQRAVVVRPGQSALAFFAATNLSDRPVTGVGTYNVAPQHAAPHFNKVQCFCFEEQRLLPGESVDMPVLFYVDPEIETDPRLRGVDALTLSYTFFLVDDGSTDAATVAARRAAVDEVRAAEEVAASRA